MTTKDGGQCGQTVVQMLIEAALEAGFTHAAPLKTETLRFLPEVREMCNQDRCHHYDTNWMCPPACGTLEECAAKAIGFKEGMIVQSVGDVEDSFDIEAMERIEQEHKKRFQDLAAVLGASYPHVLALGGWFLRPLPVLHLSRRPVPLSRQSDLLNGSQRPVGERRVREEWGALQLRPERDGFHELYPGERSGIAGLFGRFLTASSRLVESATLSGRDGRWHKALDSAGKAVKR